MLPLQPCNAIVLLELFRVISKEFILLEKLDHNVVSARRRWQYFFVASSFIFDFFQNFRWNQIYQSSPQIKKSRLQSFMIASMLWILKTEEKRTSAEEIISPTSSLMVQCLFVIVCRGRCDDRVRQIYSFLSVVVVVRQIWTISRGKPLSQLETNVEQK